MRFQWPINLRVHGKKDSIDFIKKHFPPYMKYLDLSFLIVENENQDELVGILKALPPELDSLYMGGNPNNGRRLLGRKTTAELVEIFRALPRKLTFFKLTLADIGHRTSEELVQIFKALPPDLNTLIFNLGGPAWPKDELIKLHRALPSNVTAFSVWPLNRESGSNIVEIIAALPRGITSLNLSENGLGKKTVAELIAIFKALPPGLKTLNLADNEFYHKSPEELAAILEALPSGLTSLRLSPDDVRVVELFDVRIIKALPKGLTSFRFSGRGFERLPVATLVDVFKALPRTIKSLVLSRQDIFLKKPAELALILKELPQGLGSLDLTESLNPEHGDLTPIDTLVGIVKALPAGLNSLDLGGNKLNNYSVSDLVKLMGALPPNLKSLNLSNNGLRDKSKEELIELFRALPSDLASLDLGNNQLAHLSKEDLIEVFNALPPNLTSLNVIEKDPHPNVVNKIRLKTVANLFPALRTLLFSNTTITALEYGELDDRLEEDPADIEKMLERNRRIQRLANFESTLRYNVYWHKPQQEDKESGLSPYNHVTELDGLLQQALNDFDEITQENPRLPPEAMNKLLQQMLPFFAVYHLRCVPNREDNSTLDAIDPSVAAAEACLASLPKDSKEFRITSFHIGQYYSQRAMSLMESDNENAQKFAQKALEYWQSMQREDDLFGEMSQLHTMLTALINNEHHIGWDTQKWVSRPNTSPAKPLNIDKVRGDLNQTTARGRIHLPERLLHEEFFREHDKLLAKSQTSLGIGSALRQWGLFGLLGLKTEVSRGMGLSEILQLAQDENYRSRQVCMTLGWMNDDGSLNQDNPNLPLVVRQLSQNAPNEGLDS